MAMWRLSAPPAAILERLETAVALVAEPRQASVGRSGGRNRAERGRNGGVSGWRGGRAGSGIEERRWPKQSLPGLGVGSSLVQRTCKLAGRKLNKLSL